MRILPKKGLTVPFYLRTYRNAKSLFLKSRSVKIRPVYVILSDGRSEESLVALFASGLLGDSSSSKMPFGCYAPQTCPELVEGMTFKKPVLRL